MIKSKTTLIISLLFILILPLRLFAAGQLKIDVVPIVFKNALIIDGNGGKPIDNGTLVIQGGKIIAVGKKDAVKIPESAQVIDMQGKTIMPALIDTHSHLGLTKNTTLSDTNNTRENVLRQLKLFAQYGVGAVTSLGRDKEFIYELRRQRNNGLLGNQYAYIITAGQGIGVPDGAPPKMSGPDPVYRPNTFEAIAQDVATLATKSPDVVKIWVDDFYHSLPKMKPEMYQEVIKKAHQHNLRVAAHMYYLDDAKSLVNSGVDILEHSVRDKPVDMELINAMKKHKVAIVPTLQLDESYYIYTESPSWMQDDFFLNALEPGVLDVLNGKTKIPSYIPKLSEKQTLSIAMHNIKTLYQHGILVGLGADSGAKVERIQGFAEHRELQLLVKAGLTPMDAIKIGTANSAKIMGVDQYMGTLEPGKKANLLILDANPLSNIKNTQRINAVWLDGKPVSRDSLFKKDNQNKKLQP